LKIKGGWFYVRRSKKRKWSYGSRTGRNQRWTSDTKQQLTTILKHVYFIDSNKTKLGNINIKHGILDIGFF